MSVPVNAPVGGEVAPPVQVQEAAFVQFPPLVVQDWAKTDSFRNDDSKTNRVSKDHLGNLTWNSLNKCIVLAASYFAKFTDKFIKYFILVVGVFFGEKGMSLLQKVIKSTMNFLL